MYNDLCFHANSYTKTPSEAHIMCLGNKKITTFLRCSTICFIFQESHVFHNFVFCSSNSLFFMKHALMKTWVEARTQRQVLGAYSRSQSSRPSSLALRLPEFWFGGRLEALVLPPSLMPRLPVDTTVFIRYVRAVLNSFRRAREGCSVEMSFIKAKSSCLSMMLRQGLS